MGRNRVVLTGLVGLVGAIILTTICFLVMVGELIPTLVTNPIFAWGLFLFLLIFSIAEIPVMIFGIRRIAASANPRAKYMALWVNAGYIFFAAAYAAPFILLTGWLGLGLVLAALSCIRFITAIIYL